MEAYYNIIAGKIKGLQTQSKMLRRALEDYIDAALQLTEIQPLNETNPKFSNAYLFVVTTDGVYEVYRDYKNNRNKQFCRKSILSPELFSSDLKVEELGKPFKKVKYNVYSVKNPSSELPLESLIKNAISTIHYELLQKKGKTMGDIEKRKTIGQRLVGRIKYIRDTISQIKNTYLIHFHERYRH